MGVAERRARERDEKRQRILDAAAELLITDGFDKLTIRRIAEKLEYSSGVIYNYFADKSEIIYGYCDEVFDRLYASLQEIEEAKLEPLEAFHEAGMRYIQFGLDNPTAYVIAFCLPPPRDIEGFLMHETPSGTRSLEVLSNLIQRCMDAGVFRAGDANAAAQVVWFHVHGLVSMLILAHGHYGLPWASKEALIHTSLEMISRGLRTEAPVATSGRGKR